MKPVYYTPHRTLYIVYWRIDGHIGHGYPCSYEHAANELMWAKKEHGPGTHMMVPLPDHITSSIMKEVGMTMDHFFTAEIGEE